MHRLCWTERIAVGMLMAGPAATVSFAAKKRGVGNAPLAKTRRRHEKTCRQRNKIGGTTAAKDPCESCGTGVPPVLVHGQDARATARLAVWSQRSRRSNKT